MVFASVFMVVLIVLLVMVSRASTYSKRIVREWSDDANQPSQQILNVVAAMSPAERVALFPTLSVMPTGAPSETPELTPRRHATKVRISA